MSSSPGKVLKQKLRRGKTVFGFWVTLESPTVTEIAARMGFDFVLVDAERAPLGPKELAEHLRVANLCGVAAIVHSPQIDPAIIGQVLDLGADGLFAPHVHSVDDVRRAVEYAKYPPIGTRGIAGQRATRWGKAFRERVQRANDETLVIPMIETVEAGEAIDEIAMVPHVDALWFGPADYSASAGLPGEWEGPGVARTLLECKRRARTRGVPCGVLAPTPESARQRLRQKFQLIGLGSDTGTMIRSATEALHAVGRTIPHDAWK
jgi:2-keto-3-deoxy-L-rhamnonate aldolase RhmA